MMLPHIKFFGTISLAYLALGMVWALAYARNWTVVFTLQHCITAVLALGMMEVSTWCDPPEDTPSTYAVDVPEITVQGRASWP